MGDRGGIVPVSHYLELLNLYLKMNPTLRYALAVIAGLFAGMLTVSGVDALCGALAGNPAPKTEAEMQLVMQTMPMYVLTLMMAGWGLAGGVAGFFSTWVNRKRALNPALILGALLMVATAANLYAIPHPGFMWVGVLFPVPCARLGAQLAFRLF